MGVRPPALAKLTRPRIFEAVARPRLFTLLDEAAKRPIVWICAPPGAGKTTLVASYLESRGRPHIWYQIDVGDADPATFVHYMRVAAQQFVRKSAALPLFPPQPQQDLSRFARSFFRDLFGVLPRPCVVVLDNFQDAQAAPEHRAAFAQGLEEIPEGITFFVVSREDPPPEFARLAASRRIGRLEESALRCTAGEADAILGRRALDAVLVQRILRQSNGWVAALVLLREHLTHREASIDDLLGEGKDAIFRYFTGEIFGRARPQNQRMLMLTAIAPSITPAEAVALAGDDAAPRLLEYLYRRHLFIDRRRGDETTYQYHALFREYLCEQARRRLPSEERRCATVRAADLLARRGQAAEALELYREAGEWEAMRGIIGEHALEWARQGRAQVLSDWIEALPESLRTADPWLEYWWGRAWIFLQPHRGRPALERAFEAFRASGDRRGQALALATIVTGYYYEWADFRPLDRWLPEFDRLLPDGEPAALDRQSELRLRAAQLIALLFRRPEVTAIERSAARLDSLIDEESDANVRVMAASVLLNTYNWIKTEGTDSAARLVARTEPVLAGSEVAPLMQVWWRTHLSFWHYVDGRYDAAAAVIRQAREIAERYGVEAYLYEIDHGQAIALISNGELDEAGVLIEAIERRLAPARRMDWAYLHYLRSMLMQRRGRFTAAVKDAERALVLGRETGLPTMQVPQFLMRLAHSRGAAGDRRGCLQAIDEAISLASGVNRGDFEKLREYIHVDDDLDAGRIAEAARRLAAALADNRERGQLVFLRQRPDLAAKLADFALAHDIEPDFVRTLIERNGIPAPAGASDAWPFRLRVRVLGRFELMRDGRAISFSGKQQQRPLDLLKLIVALGGHEVDSQQLMAALWPEAEGDAAKSAFDTTLFRLRKLLDVEHAVALTGGKVSLSTALAWTDVRALEVAIAAALRTGDGPEPTLADAARRLCDAYGGALLGEEEAPWLAKPRDALRARFTRALLQLGELLERGGHWRSAVDLYRRGLEADNLAESFYRGLMRSLAAGGEQAEALNAYRRCRELLSIVLGVKPSAETESLYRQVAGGGTAHTSA